MLTTEGQNRKAPRMTNIGKPQPQPKHSNKESETYRYDDWKKPQPTPTGEQTTLDQSTTPIRSTIIRQQSPGQSSTPIQPYLDYLLRINDL